MRRNLTIALLAFAALVGTWQLTPSVGAQEKLTLAKVLTGLNTQGKTPETNTLAKRNIYITQRVKTYGVTFRLTPDIESELRNAGATSVLIETIRRYGPSVQPTPRINTTPSATFKEVWVDYDQERNGVKGMVFHVKFATNQMKGLPSLVAIYFMDEDGRFLKDNNKKMLSSSGEVAVYRELEPCCDVAEYNDLDVFMPYDELDLPDGEYTLKADIKVIYKAGGLISPLTQKAFTYSQKPKRNPDAVTATVKRVWIDYNVKEGGRTGMRVHVNFQVGGLLNVSSQVAVRIAKSDDTYVPGSSDYFMNEDGAFRAIFKLKPIYDPAVYSDAAIFIPYDEIVISKGKWNLRLDIDLNYDDDELIKHLHWEPFTFTQK